MPQWYPAFFHQKEVYARFSHLHLEERQLLSVRFTQTADAQAQQPQRTRNQLVPTQQKTSQPVNVSRLCDRFLDRNLPRQRGEITVAHLHLDGVGTQSSVLKPGRDIRCLFSQASMLTSTPADSTASINIGEVNCDPWSVLEINGA
jgi:hypothetical protein